MAGNSGRVLARLEAATRAAERARGAASEAARKHAAAESRRRKAFEAALMAVAREAGLDRVDPATWTSALRQAAAQAPVPAAAAARSVASAKRSPRIGDADGAAPRRAAKPARDEQGRLLVRLKFSSNVGAEKGGIIERVGLRWNGRKAKWIGYVDQAGIAELLTVFGADRLIVASAEDRIETDEDLPPAGGAALNGVSAEPPSVEPEKSASVDRPGRPDEEDRFEQPDTPHYRYSASVDLHPDTPLEDMSEEVLASVVRRVVEAEGPIHRTVVCERIRKAHNRRILPNPIRGRITAIAESLPRDPCVADDAGFLMLPGTALHVRDRRAADDKTRHYQHLPLAELRLAGAQAPARDDATTEAAIAAAVARRLGYKLITHGTASRIRNAITSAPAA